MTLIALVSAKGAPGVTTLAVALAALAGADAVAADLDPFGGDLALRYRRADGRPLDPDVGLLSLAATIRGDVAPGRPARETVLTDHVQLADGGLAVLTGVNGPEQATGLGPLWPRVARALAVGGTVFADCGRISATSPVLPVLQTADAVVMLARAELEELAHLRERLRTLVGVVPAGVRLGAVMVTSDRERGARERTQQLLRSAGLKVPVIGTVADDPRGAAVLRGTRAGRPGRTLLIRSTRSLLPSLLALAGPRPGEDPEPMREHRIGPLRALSPQDDAHDHAQHDAPDVEPPHQVVAVRPAAAVPPVDVPQAVPQVAEPHATEPPMVEPQAVEAPDVPLVSQDLPARNARPHNGRSAFSVHGPAAEH